MNNVHPLFDIILHNQFQALRYVPSEEDKELMRKRLEDEKEEMPTWLRGQLIALTQD